MQVIQKSTKTFFFDFLHGLIELIEFYKTLYIKIVLNPIFSDKNIKKYEKNAILIYRGYRRKTLDFSINSILVIFHYPDSLKICSMNTAWKTASNGISFIILTCDMVRRLLSTRKHPSFSLTLKS